MASWKDIHPAIKDECRDKYDNDHYAAAVSFAIIELNDTIKKYIKNIYEIEMDGAELFRRVFSPQKSILRFRKEDDQTSKSLQEGYMQIFTGVWIGIRNPNAHKNLGIDSIEAYEIITICSHLFRIFDKAKKNNLLRLDEIDTDILKNLQKKDFLFFNNKKDPRRWINIKGTLHHIHDGNTYGSIVKLNMHLNHPTLITSEYLRTLNPGPEIISK
ncbi:MAG: TIGR02391 family protein [Bacteroidota bacterium]